MHLRDILRTKGGKVHTIDSSLNLADVVAKLVEHNCGSLVVADDEGKMVGIITERDILRACAELDEPLENIPLAARMTTEVVTGNPNDEISQVMGLLTQRRIRHLPVLQGDRLIGLISIGDVVKAQHHQLTVENHYLMSYIQS